MIRTAERLEALDRVLDDLRELNASIPVLVEGKRDVAALRALGLPGEILMVHSGNALIDVCDALAERYTEVVALTDWDRTGGHIMRHLRDNLRGRVKLHREIRKTLATYSEVHDIEALPAYLATLREKVRAHTGQTPPSPLAHPDEEP